MMNDDPEWFARAYDAGKISLDRVIYEIGDKSLIDDTLIEAMPISVVGDLWRKLHLKAFARDTDLPEIASPWQDLNKIIGAFEPTFLYVVGGDTSAGKSFLACNIACKVALDAFSVLYFSPEMGERALSSRILGILAGMDSFEIMRAFRRKVGLDLRERAEKTIEEFGNDFPIFCDCSPVMSIPEIYVRTEALKPELVIVDYIQRLASDLSGDNIEREMSGIFNGLVRVARECEVPLVAVSQYSRGQRRKAGKEASIFAFRGSGTIEQAADVCIQLKRPELAEGKPIKIGSVAVPGYTEAVVTKNRNGPTGVVELVFKPTTGKFIAFTEEEAEQWV